MNFLKKLAPFVMLTGLLLIFFLPSLTGRTFISTGMLYSDLMSFNYPLKDWYKELLARGQLPFWTSLLGNGFPVFAEGQIGALYPFHLVLFCLLPTLLAFNLNLFLHFFMAAGFTFAFCRVSLKLSRTASLLAGLTYSLSGFFLTHLHQVNIILVVSYLPLLFLVIERLVTTRKSLWSFVLALVLALQILAGFIQIFYYTSLVGGLFFLLISLLFPSGEKKGSLRPTLVLFALAFALGVGMTACQVLPTWELTKFSHRASGLSLEAALGYAWPLKALSLFVNPRAYDIYYPESGFHPFKPTSVNFNVLYGYVGIIPLILALLAILALFRRRFVLIFTVFLLGGFLFGLGRSTQLFAIFWEIIPGMKFFRQPVKILFLIEFSLAVLAGFGLDYLGEFLMRKKTSLKAHLPVLGGFLILITFVDLYFNNCLWVQPTIDAGEWFTKPAAASFLQNELDDSLFRYNTHGTSNLDYGLIRDYNLQKEFQNILIVDFNLLYRLPSNGEWFALFLKRQQELNSQSTILDVKTGNLRLPPSLKKTLDIQSVKFLIANLPIEDQDLVLRKEIPFSREVDHYGFFRDPEGIRTVTVPARATYIYENKKVYPRVLFVSKTRIVGDEREALEKILDEAFDPRGEVILEEEPGEEFLISNPPAGEAGSQFLISEAKIEAIDDQESQFTVQLVTEHPGFLVLADTYYPGWRAVVRPLANYGSAQRAAGIASGDARQAKIYRANYAFRAVAVPAGKHLVGFIFEPTHWRLGLGISAGALLITFIGLGYCWLKKK